MGLNNQEVIESRKKYGSNRITKGKKTGFGKLFLESFGDPIIKILLVALTIKIVFLFKSFDWFETLGIFIAVFLASLISSISEYGSEMAFKSLQEGSSKEFVKVMRSNKVQEINIDDVVVNDIVIATSGERIPADGIIIEGQLLVDESILNGETKEVNKIAFSKNEKNFMVYRGTSIITGNAKIKIASVGDNTVYGSIAKELQEKSSESPLKLKLRDLAATISKFGYIGSILATLAYLYMEIIVKNNYNFELILGTITNFDLMFNYLIYALTLSVTIIVVAVPEGLPMMITLVLSSNMRRMLKDKVLVRKLVGIETAGSMNVLLTDKTGTLTKGKLSVVDFITSDGNRYKTVNELSTGLYDEVLMNCYYNNESILENGRIMGGNITDRAILEFVKTTPIKKVFITNHELFDSKKKYSSIEINHKKYYKGAPEILLPHCTQFYDSKGILNKLYNKNVIEKQIKRFTNDGYRVLVLVNQENGIYTYVGLLRIKDEIRNETISGLSIIKKAGIQTIMITGDNRETATCIAKEIGLVTKEEDLIIDSIQLNRMSDEEIKKVIPSLRVIARSMPQDKSRLVGILQDMNLVVGMTGDGVNDAPALKKADVGFAMGSGTEVAKEASDIVILDDNLLSISKAVLYGRTIFKSIRKFIIYQLGVNACALIISIIGTLIGIQNPITIVQMLWLNMIMDTFSGLAFSYEPPIEEYMEEPPKDKTEKIINKYMYSEIICSGLYSSLLCILFLKMPFFSRFIRVDSQNRYLMTAYFAMFIFIGIVNAFSARTSRINIFANIWKNKVFLFIFTFILIVQIYIIYYGGNLFRTYGLTTRELIFVFSISLTALPIDICRKVFLRKKEYNTSI